MRSSTPTTFSITPRSGARRATRRWLGCATTTNIDRLPVSLCFPIMQRHRHRCGWTWFGTLEAIAIALSLGASAIVAADEAGRLANLSVRAVAAAGDNALSA